MQIQKDVHSLFCKKLKSKLYNSRETHPIYAEKNKENIFSCICTESFWRTPKKLSHHHAWEQKCGEGGGRSKTYFSLSIFLLWLIFWNFFFFFYYFLFKSRFSLFRSFQLDGTYKKKALKHSFKISLKKCFRWQCLLETTVPTSPSTNEEEGNLPRARATIWAHPSSLPHWKYQRQR